MTLGSKTVKRWSTDMLERGQVGAKLEIFSGFFSRRFVHFGGLFLCSHQLLEKELFWKDKQKAGSIFGKEFWPENTDN